MVGVLVLLPALVGSAQPGWFGPDGGSGGAAEIKKCVDTSGFTSPLTFTDIKKTTFSTKGLSTNDCIATASGDCLEWTASGNVICQKAYGQTCLSVIDEFCEVYACTESLYVLSFAELYPRAAYCNVQCPAGTYNTAAAVRVNVCACSLLPHVVYRTYIVQHVEHIELKLSYSLISHAVICSN